MMTALIALGLTALYLLAGIPSQRRLTHSMFKSLRDAQEQWTLTPASERSSAQWATLWTLLLWPVWPLGLVYVLMFDRWFPQIRLAELRAENERLQEENAALERRLRDER